MVIKKGFLGHPLFVVKTGLITPVGNRPSIFTHHYHCCFISLQLSTGSPSDILQKWSNFQMLTKYLSLYLCKVVLCPVTQSRSEFRWLFCLCAEYQHDRELWEIGLMDAYFPSMKQSFSHCTLIITPLGPGLHVFTQWRCYLFSFGNIRSTFSCICYTNTNSKIKCFPNPWNSEIFWA